MNKPHKHAEFIKAWADGAAIQFRPVLGHGEWVDEPRHLLWDDHAEYRIKPEPKPDIVRYLSFVHPSGDHCFIHSDKDMNSDIKITFDGDSYKIKSMEIVR